MLEIFKKFEKELKKSLSYFILKTEDINFVIGTKQIIQEYREKGNNPLNFQAPHIKITTKEKPVFFLVTFNDINTKNHPEIVKTFLDNQLPILKLSLYKKNDFIVISSRGAINQRQAINLENIEDVFNNFVNSIL